MRIGWGLLLGLTVWLLADADAFADKRVALVIGNSDYRNAARLPNPVNDAAAVADLLRKAGFEVVDSFHDLAADEFRRTLRTFARRVADAEMAIVFYAGHGMEVNGINYLVPVDARLESDIDIEDETISLDRVLTTMAPARRLRLVILDACRDNPFAGAMKRTIATRAIGRGLAEVEPMTSNTLIAFAAKAASVAADGTGPHSPFTSALIKHIAEPGLDLRIAFGRVRDEVLEITGQKQEPFVYGSLGGTTVSLVPPPQPKPSGTAASRPPAPAGNPNAEIRADYQLTKEVGTLEAWDYFLKQHGSGFYADLAKAQRAKLVAVQSAPKADARVGEDQAIPPSGTSPAAATPTVDVDAALGREQGAMGAAEENDKAVAAVAPKKAAVETAAQPGHVVEAAELGRLLQSHLRRVGCEPGATDGTWNDGSKSALARFNTNAGTRFDVQVASLDALDAVRSRTSRVCPLLCEQGFKAVGERCVRKSRATAKPVATVGPHHRSAAPRAGGKCLSFNGTRVCE